MDRPAPHPTSNARRARPSRRADRTSRAWIGGRSKAYAAASREADTVHTAFAQDLPEADRWLIHAGQRPITLGANTTPSAAPAWRTLPSWAVVGTEDLVIPPATQRSMAERAGATITEAAGSHVSMVSQPKVTLDAILAAVAAVA